MNPSLVDQVVEAVLYEGYLLYPYRPSIKNRQRWTFGGVFPESYRQASSDGDPSMMQAECLMEGSKDSRVDAAVRFLHPLQRTSISVSGSVETWQEAREQQIQIAPCRLGDLLTGGIQKPFAFGATREEENAGASSCGTIVREQQAIQGQVELSAVELESGLFRLRVAVVNSTPLDMAAALTRDEAALQALVSTHMILHVEDGSFVSSIDPPKEHAQAAEACRNVGSWPVLVGESGERDAMLCSPIILYDYPKVAPESPGNLFDATEIDEILSLRIMTLTDEEKASAAAIDPRAHALMQRTESLAREQLTRLHGTMRDCDDSVRRNSSHRAGFCEPGQLPGVTDAGSDSVFASQMLGPHPFEDPLEQKRELEKTLSAGIELKRGDRVTLHPRGNADIFDIALRGKTATIAAIEQDFENRIHLAVTIDDDPGADYGRDGNVVGHRFFFSPEEVEVVSEIGVNREGTKTRRGEEGWNE